MTAIFEHPITVTADDIDSRGHVNNLRYILWTLAAAEAHCASLGWDSQRVLAMGSSWVVKSHEIHYRAPLFEGDEIVVRTWVSDFRKIQSLRKYRIIRQSDGATVADAQTNWAYIGIEHQVPRRVPEEMKNAFTIVPPDEEPAD